MYKIRFSKRAVRSLRKLPNNIGGNIKNKLIDLSKDPYAKNNNITKLQNRPGYRLRIGGWRVIYEIKNDEVIILVLDIGSRGGIYG